MRKSSGTDKPQRKINTETKPKGEALIELAARRLSMLMRLPLLLSLTRRALLFFVFLLCAEIILFFSGNIQNFLDENLELILFGICCASIGAAFFALAAAAECVYYIIATKKLYYYFHLAIFIIFLIAAVFACLVSGSAEVLSRGIKI